MKCPFCGHGDNRVIDSRLSKDNSAIRRRRECLACGKRFTTYEFVEEILPLVVKKDGRREAFDRGKLLAGIKKACEKRPIGIEAMENCVDNIEKACQDHPAREISSSIIGEKVMQELRKLDGVAYVRFASVYRDFRDINEFLDELKGLLQDQRTMINEQ
ncbi:MAG: transcriptional regulator NrdR [Smithellaceae bacterium]|nr:transcriptional regulator NrdR [Smithellaceae bacterium]